MFDLCASEHRMLSSKLGSSRTQPLRQARLVAMTLALMAAMAPAASRAQSGPQPTIYDQPLETTHGTVKSDLVESGGGLICYRYSQFMVKRIDSGSPAGDVSVAVVPTVAGPNAPTCTTQQMSGEVSFKGDGYSFAGIKGNFLVMSATDPNGGVPFKVYDRRSANVRYADASDEHGLTFIADESDSLHIRFRRGVNSTCSIPKDGQTCWATTAREAHFSNAVARLPAPIASCTAVYQQQKVAIDDPSIIVYDVDLVVAPQGGAHVVSRGEVSCEPLP